MNKNKELASGNNVIIGVEPWKVELLWGLMRGLAQGVDSIIEKQKWGSAHSLSEGSAYIEQGSQGEAYKIHNLRVYIIRKFLKKEIEEGNVRIEDGGIKTPESLRRKRKKMRGSTESETYLRDLSRVRIVCKDSLSLLRIFKKFGLYVGYINPGNLFLSGVAHRFSPKARPTIFPAVYLYLGEFPSGKIGILEHQLNSLEAKKNQLDGCKDSMDPNTDEWKKAEKQWTALLKRIKKLELLKKTELQALQSHGVSTEVQFMTENVRSVAEINRKDYSREVGGGSESIIDFTEYNQQMIAAILKDLMSFNE